MLIDATIEGFRPLLMHNGQLADPLNPWAKELAALTRKKGKTDLDHEAIARAEWNGGLYYDDTAQKVTIPGDMLDAVLKEGAKKKRRGKDMASGVEVAGMEYPLAYDGPNSRGDLWAASTSTGHPIYRDRRGARVNQARVVRTRPKFPEWRLDFQIRVHTFSSLSFDDVKAALEDAGLQCGMGDFRGRYGLFRVLRFVKSADK